MLEAGLCLPRRGPSAGQGAALLSRRLAPQSPALAREVRTESLRIHYRLFVLLCSRQQL